MTIKVGDLVMVVRGMPCCGASTESQGTVFRIESFRPNNEGTKCWSCGAVVARIDPTVANRERGRPIQVSRLKKIPPLSELEGEKRDTDLKEPA